MSFRTIVTAVLVFAVFAAGGVAAYQVADTSQDIAAQENATASGEAIVQQPGVWQFVDAATESSTTGFTENITATNSTGVELTRGEDYRWNATDGTINYENTTSVQDGANGTVSYEYRANTAAVQQVAGPLSAITSGLGLAGLFAGGVALVVFLLGFAAFMARTFGNSGTSPTGR